MSYLVLAGCLAVAGALSVLIQSYTHTLYVNRSTRDLRNRLTGHIQRLPISFLEKRHTGDTVSRINGDVEVCSGVWSGIQLWPPVGLLGPQTVGMQNLNT